MFPNSLVDQDKVNKSTSSLCSYFNKRSCRRRIIRDETDFLYPPSYPGVNVEHTDEFPATGGDNLRLTGLETCHHITDLAQSGTTRHQLTDVPYRGSGSLRDVVFVVRSDKVVGLELVPAEIIIDHFRAELIP